MNENRIKELEELNEQHKKINGELRQENKLLKEIVNKYFEKNMCVSFDKFIENWEETNKWLEFYKKENKQLQSRIDKAIEYIKENTCYDNAFGKYSCLSCLEGVECDELLKILKGDSNE